MPPGNRLAPVTQNAFGSPPTLAEIQLAARTAQRPSPMTLGQRAQELNYGLGRGFTNILQGNLDLAQALYQDPRAVGMGFVDAATQLVQDPAGVVGNSLRGMWNRAKSSPAGLGEVVGENIDPRNWLKPRKAVVSQIDTWHGTSPESAKAILESGFDLTKEKTGQNFSSQVPGIWLSSSPTEASRFGKEVLQQDIDLKKPYKIKASTYLQKFLYNGEDPVTFRDKLQSKGYDGLHITAHPEYKGGRGPSGTEEWGVDNYVVFDPSRIKLKK